MNAVSHYARQKGIGLIELMVALVLGAVLMLGVTRMFATSVSNSSTETALAQVQDSARVAMEMIKRDVRMAGFQGCASPAARRADHSIVNLSQNNVVIANGNNNTSDTLSVFRAFEIGDDPIRVTSFQNADSAISLSQDLCHADNDIFLVTDCNSVATFTPTENEGCRSTITPGDLSTPANQLDLGDFAPSQACELGNTEQCPTLYQVGSANGSTYEIRNRTDQAGNNILGADNQPLFALFRDGEEMVEGIENMQVLYGIAMDNGTTRYSNVACTDAQVENGNCNITHIQVSLVVASSIPVLQGNSTRNWSILNTGANDSTLQTNDRRLRRVFTSTIQIRNRG